MNTGSRPAAMMCRMTVFVIRGASPGQPDNEVRQLG